MPTKTLTGTGAAENHVHCGLQLQGYSCRTCCPSWHHSRCCLLQKCLCIVSGHASCSQDLVCYMTTLTVTLLARLICSEDGIRKFWNIHNTNCIWTNPYDYDLFRKVKESLCGIHFGMRDGVSALEHAVTDISRTDTADGVRHLPQVWQHVCNVAGGCIYGL
jgi:hypothetical protein